MEVLKESQKKNRERSPLSKDVFAVVDGRLSGSAAGAGGGGGGAAMSRVEVQAWNAGEKQASLAC